MVLNSPTNREPTNPDVANYLHYFEENGAVQVSDTFTVASPEEAEFVYDGQRYLLAPRDEHYGRYKAVLDDANAPYVDELPYFSDQKIVVGEISRDARTLPQVMRSKQPKKGETLAAVFLDMGRTLGSIIESSRIAPVVGSLSLGRILVLREESRVLLPPSVDFEVASIDAVEKIVQHMKEELLPAYEKFGGVALLEAFIEGINHDGSTD